MEQISDERVAELLYDLQAPDNEWEGLSALVERHEVVQALDDLQAARETIKALQGGKYYHDLHCNVSRDEPMGVCWLLMLHVPAGGRGGEEN